MKVSASIPSRIIVAGESGGGNLTLATGMRLLREGKIESRSGTLFALCPYIAGNLAASREPLLHREQWHHA